MLPYNKLPDTEVVWSQNLQHDLIRLLHLFCAVSRSAVECCRGVRWSKFGICSTRVFFAASCSECRGRCKDPAEIPPPPESTPSDRFRSHSSINVIMRISVLLGFVPGHFEVFVRLVSSDLSDISISICQVRSARVVSQSMGVALSQSDSCDYL